MYAWPPPSLSLLHFLCWVSLWPMFMILYFCLRIGGLLWIRKWTFEFCKRQETCWLAEWLLASQKGLCSMEWASYLPLAQSDVCSRTSSGLSVKWWWWWWWWCGSDLLKHIVRNDPPSKFLFPKGLNATGTWTDFFSPFSSNVRNA
jgi:hypothetical protein